MYKCIKRVFSKSSNVQKSQILLIALESKIIVDKLSEIKSVSTEELVDISKGKIRMYDVICEMINANLVMYDAKGLIKWH